MTKDEKDRIKKFLEGKKPKVEINNESTIEEVRIFLEKKLNFAEKGIKYIEELGVENGENLLSLELDDINKTEELKK